MREKIKKGDIYRANINDQNFTKIVTRYIKALNTFIKILEISRRAGKETQGTLSLGT